MIPTYIRSKKGSSGWIFYLLFVIIVVGVGFGFYWYMFLQPVPIVTKVVMTQDMVDMLNSHFISNNENFVLCLEGDIENGVLTVTKADFPDFVNMTEDKHLITLCNKDSITSVHSHKNNVCRMSIHDAYALGILEPHVLGIICGTDKILFFTPESLEDGIEVVII